MIRRTFGSVKNQLARVTQNGMCATDPQLLARVNEAQERLLNKGLYAGTYARYAVCIYGACITLPREFESIVGYNFEGKPCQVYNQWYEFMANGPGISQAGDWRRLIDRGYAPTFRSLEAQKYIKVYTDLAEDASATILIRGSDTYNNRVQTIENGSYIDGERLNLSAGSGNSSVLVFGLTGNNIAGNGVYAWYTTTYSKPAYKNINGWTMQWNGADGWYIVSPDNSFEIDSNSGSENYPWLASWSGSESGIVLTELPRTTRNAFRDIDAINKTATKGWVRIYAVDPTTGSESCIGILAPDETLPMYRRYALPGYSNTDGSAVTVLAKKKFIPVVSDDDDLIITNLGALKMMLIAIEKEENNNLDEAMKYEQKAVLLLQEELKEVQGSIVALPQIQMEAFAMGEIPAMA
jgi:hypothetical protein